MGVAVAQRPELQLKRIEVLLRVMVARLEESHVHAVDDEVARRALERVALLEARVKPIIALPRTADILVRALQERFDSLEQRLQNALEEPMSGARLVTDSLEPVTQRVEALERHLLPLAEGWQRHLPRLLNAISSVAAFGHEIAAIKRGVAISRDTFKQLETEVQRCATDLLSSSARDYALSQRLDEVTSILAEEQTNLRRANEEASKTRERLTELNIGLLRLLTSSDNVEVQALPAIDVAQQTRDAVALLRSDIDTLRSLLDSTIKEGHSDSTKLDQVSSTVRALSEALNDQRELTKIDRNVIFSLQNESSFLSSQLLVGSERQDDFENHLAEIGAELKGQSAGLEAFSTSLSAADQAIRHVELIIADESNLRVTLASNLDETSRSLIAFKEHALELISSIKHRLASAVPLPVKSSQAKNVPSASVLNHEAQDGHVVGAITGYKNGLSQRNGSQSEETSGQETSPVSEGQSEAAVSIKRLERPRFRARGYEDGASKHAVVVSGCGDENTGGGLYLATSKGVEVLDSVSSMGLAGSGSSLARILRSPGSEQPLFEIIAYDPTGIKRYLRVDGESDPHDIINVDGRYVVSCPATNAVVWISDSGHVERKLKLPGTGDAWHVNSLYNLGGRIYASAFGSFEEHRQWDSIEATQGSGLIFDLESLEPVVRGLTRPHHPRFVDGLWYVCNSGANEVIAIDPRDGSVQRRCSLDGFTRGLAFSDENVFVGVSVNRHESTDGYAHIAMLDRLTLQQLSVIEVPASEIYDIQLISLELCEGLRVGFNANRFRPMSVDQNHLLHDIGTADRSFLVMNPLPAADMQVRITATLGSHVQVEELIDVPVRLTNESFTTYCSAPPFPVNMSYKWLLQGTETLVDDSTAQRTELKAPLVPSQVSDETLKLTAPSAPGTYELRLTLVQERTFWFDDASKENCWRAVVTVLPSLTCH